MMKLDNEDLKKLYREDQAKVLETSELSVKELDDDMLELVVGGEGGYSSGSNLC